MTLENIGLLTAFLAGLVSFLSPCVLGVPFLLSAAFTDVLMRRLKSARRLGRFLQVGAGVVMMLMGVAMITGTMSNFAFWLLETFPILSKIG